MGQLCLQSSSANMSERGLTAADRRRSLIAIYGAAAAFGFTFGLSSPLLSLILESRQVGSSVIGLNGAMTALGILASAPVIPFLIRKLGVMRFITTSVSLATLTLLLLRAVDDLSIWFPLRFLLGVALNGLLLTSETWINQIADGASRGRAIGIYVTVLAAAFALGPIIIPLTGTEGWTPFLIGAAVIMASAFAFLPVRRIAPRFDDHQTVAVLSFFRVAPTLMAAVAAVAVIDGALIVHLAVYGLRLEATLAVAAGMISAFMIGNVLLQIPLGWMADRLNGYRVLATCAAIGIFCGLAVAALGPSDAILWPILVIWGGSTYGMYTIALTLLGHRFSGNNLVAANAAFALMWGVGGIAGPAAGGLAMDAVGPPGLPLTIVVTCVLFLVLLVIRRPEILRR